MNVKQEKLALALFDNGLVLIDGPFKFKLHEKSPDAPQSPLKINLRFPPKGVLSWSLVDQIVEALYEVSLANELYYSCVIGVPEAANRIANSFAKIASVSQVFLEKKETEAVRRVVPKISGDHQRGWRALILDDVAVMAHSKIEAIKAAQSNGLTVKDVVVLVDWEHGGKEALEEAGFCLYSVFKMRELLSFYFKEGKLSETKYQETIAYLGAIKAYFSKS